MGHRGGEHHCFIPLGRELVAEQEQNLCPQDAMEDRRTDSGDAKHAADVLGLSTGAYSSSLLHVSLCCP